MSRLAVCLSLVNLFFSCLVFGQWTQLGSNMPGDSDSEFGNNVDFNYAGNIMIGGTNSNYVKVYQEQGGAWTQLGNTLVGPVGEAYGWGVSINGAGNIIAVGEFGGVGKIHVYELIENVWTALGMPVEGGIHNSYFDNFGYAVDLNEAGDRFVASSLYGNLGNGTEAGFVQVYDLVDGEWVQVGSSLQGISAGNHFGQTVQMTADGSRFIVSADGGDQAIYVFEEIDGDWQAVGQTFFGSQFGNTILYNPSIDMLGNTISFTQYTGPQGTRVYGLEDNLWVLKGSLIAYGGVSSLNGDGSIIGISRSNGDGAARVYQYQTDDWVQLDNNILGDPGDYLGVSCALNYNGNRFLLGAVGAGPSLTGATKVYENGNISYAPIPYLNELPEIAGECSVESIEAPLAYNNNDDQIEGVTMTEFPILESTTIVWTYDDGNGFVSIQEQNIVVEDTEAPTPDVEALDSVNAECEVTALTTPTATDNCAAEVMVSHDATLPITTQGMTTVTWTYDDENGNSSTQEQMVIIEDTTPPVPAQAELNNLVSECELTVLIPPTAIDNCAAEVLVSHDATLPITTQGMTTVTWTYDDGNGNSSTQEQMVIIADSTPPVSTQAELNNLVSECELTVLIPPTAIDNCAAEVMVSHDATLPITMQGMTTVTWTYDDGNGNSSTQEQMVIIEDTTAPMPELESLPNITAVCELNELTPPTANDNCAATVNVSNDAVLPMTTVGSTTITWTYDDGNGNSITQSQEIIIEGIDVGVGVLDNTLTANASDVAYQWVDCSNENEPIEGATEQSFTPTVNGNYAVIITENGCEEISECTEVIIIGVEEQKNESLVIYPNPSAGVFNFQSEQGIQSVQVFDLSGKLVSTHSLNSTSTINLTHLENGYYVLRVYTSQGEINQRVAILK